MKEIVDFANEHSTVELSCDDLTRRALGCQEEQDVVDPGIVSRALNPDDSNPEQFVQDFAEMAVEWVAQQLFDYIEPFETLAYSISS